MVLTSYFMVPPLFWNKLPTKQNQFPFVSDDIYMWIFRKGSGFGRKFRNCKRKNVGGILSSFYNTRDNRPTETPSPVWVYLGLSACGSSPAGLYKAPGCPCGRWSMPHPLFFMCFSHSHLRVTSRWDSWGSGMLLGGPWALPPAGEPTESTFWSCPVPQALPPSCACSNPQLLVCCSCTCVHRGWRCAFLGTDF